MQVDSFNEFLQKDIHPQRREKKRPASRIRKCISLEDAKGNFLLEFVEYSVLQEKIYH
jgi:DNA-directed RNA polymerase subunit beta